MEYWIPAFAGMTKNVLASTDYALAIAPLGILLVDRIHLTFELLVMTGVRVART